MHKKIFLLIICILLIGIEICASSAAKQAAAVAHGKYDGTMENASKSIATLLNRLRSSEAIAVASQRANRNTPIVSNVSAASTSASDSTKQPAPWKLIRYSLTIATPEYIELADTKMKVFNILVLN